MSKLAVRCAAQPPSASPGRVGVSHCHCRSEPLYSEPHSELRPCRYAAKRQPAARFAVGSPHLQHVGSAVMVAPCRCAGLLGLAPHSPHTREGARLLRALGTSRAMPLSPWEAGMRPRCPSSTPFAAPPGTACPLPTAPSTLSSVASRPRLGMSSAVCSGPAVGRPPCCTSPRRCTAARPHLAASPHRRTAAPLHASIAQHASAQLRALFRRDHCRARRRDPSARAARARERRRDLGGA